MDLTKIRTLAESVLSDTAVPAKTLRQIKTSLPTDNHGLSVAEAAQIGVFRAKETARYLRDQFVSLDGRELAPEPTPILIGLAKHLCRQLES